MIHKQARAGFSLVEILIAVVIIGIIAAVTIPSYLGYIERSKLRTVKLDLRNIKGWVIQFNEDVGNLPETLDDLMRRPLNEELAKEWAAPYAEKIPKDPWKNAYQYRPTPDQEQQFELYSYGPKGKSAPQSAWINAWKL